MVKESKNQTLNQAGELFKKLCAECVALMSGENHEAIHEIQITIDCIKITIKPILE